jgi:serine/threonine protein kinase
MRTRTGQSMCTCRTSGVSKAAVTSVSLTGAGHFVGTPAYSAPEQIRGRAVDGRADQYALACVAYQLLTGVVPFDRDDPAAVMWAHLSEPPQSLISRRPDLPGAADPILARALAKASEDRYESCRQFANALREALGLAPYHSRGSPAPPRHSDGSGAAPNHPPAEITSGRRTGEPGPPTTDADGPANGAHVGAAEQRAQYDPGSGTPTVPAVAPASADNRDSRHANSPPSDGPPRDVGPGTGEREPIPLPPRRHRAGHAIRGRLVISAVCVALIALTIVLSASRGPVQTAASGGPTQTPSASTSSPARVVPESRLTVNVVPLDPYAGSPTSR